MAEIQRKVLAYITHDNRLLVFRQPEFPEAGIQVPGGTLEEGEAPETGVMREAREETGLQDLVLGDRLGEQLRILGGVTYHRHVYHLICASTPPEQWTHFEQFRSDSVTDPLQFDFFWADLPHGVPPLIGEMGALVPKLCERMELAGVPKSER